MYFRSEKYWQKGQTIVETALLIILLLMFFFGIAEISRAWWLKNQLNNAARVGVRVAVVTPDLVPIPETSCSSDPIITAACNSITNNDLRSSAKLTLCINNVCSGSTKAQQGDEIKLSVVGQFNSVVPNLFSRSPSLMPPSVTLTSTSSMRYE